MKTKIFSVKEITTGAVFLVLMCISGGLLKVVAPFLPFSLQPAVAVAAGLFLRPKTAFTCQTAYMVLGLSGLPVFTSGGGLAYVLNPTFGYILGFVCCSTLVSFLYHKILHKKGISVFGVLLAGLSAIYIIGVPYMYFIIRYYIGNPEFSFLGALTGNVVYFAKDTAVTLAIYMGTGKIKALKINL